MSMPHHNMPGAIVIEGHVQGLANTRTLGMRSIPVYVVDKDDCLARYSRYCRKYFRSPDYDSNEFASFLIELAEKENIRGWCLIPSNDHAVMNISRNKVRLSEYYKIITSDLSTIENIMNKQFLLETAQSIDIPIPVTYFDPDGIINGKYPDVKFPLITRGKYGLSFYRKTKEKAYVADNMDQYRIQIEEIKNKEAFQYAFTQEIIPVSKLHRTISVAAFCIRGEIKAFWMGLKLRDHPFNFGTATFAQSIYMEGLAEPSRKIIKHLGYTGVCEIEFLYDERVQKYKLIEINARTWLWVGLARQAGVDFTSMIYNHLNDLEQTFPSSYNIGLKWINWLTDLPNSVFAIIRRKLSFLEYLNSLRGRKTCAIFSRKDPVPFLAFFILLPTFLKKR